MRKNRMMRAASALMVAVLLTTSTISGTFAKYVTEASGHDEARVAKWGIEVGVVGSLFELSYKDEPETDVNTMTVKSSDSTEVVAPGTKNLDGIKFVLRGTPEVDYTVDITIKSGIGDTAVDVVLPAGTYTDYTVSTGVLEEDTDSDGVIDKRTPLYGNNFTLADAYHPLVFTLKNSDGTVLKSGKLEEIEAYLEEIVRDSGALKVYDTNVPATSIMGGDGTYTLTWEWVFENNDQADTFLGNVAAGLVALPANASISTNFTIEITVTQVD